MVAPGFIDLHSHGQDDENYRVQALDGVTTVLELEVGTGDVDVWYVQRECNALINFGASVGHIPARIEVMHDPGDFLPVADAADRAATEDEISAIVGVIERGLERGALAVGFGIDYTRAVSRWEIIEAFRVAAKHMPRAMSTCVGKATKSPTAASRPSKRSSRPRRFRERPSTLSTCRAPGCGRLATSSR